MSTPAYASAKNYEKSAPTAEVVCKYDTKQLTQFLREQEDLQLEEDDLEIIHKEKITGYAFLNMTSQDFRDAGFKVGPAVVLENFVKEVKQKATVAYSCEISDVRQIYSNYAFIPYTPLKLKIFNAFPNGM